MSVPQTLLAERYRLVRVIGTGGMGVVWEGWDERLQRPVAIKELRPGAGATDAEAEEAKNRAMREARITARLHHPRAVPVFDAVEHEGRPCLIMQYLPSTPLSALLRERLLLPHEVARIGAEVASALAEAHRLEIVHRDVKPGNILITEEGTAHISDFGISHALGDATLTRTGIVHGTPAYLAPEVARGGDSTYASDVFSLGSTLYAALEGQPPFGSDPNSMALLHRVASGRFPPPARGGPLSPFLLDMLSPGPQERPSMQAVASLLAGLQKGLGSDKTLPIPPAPHPSDRVHYGREPETGAAGEPAAPGTAAAAGPGAAGPVAAGAAAAAAAAAVVPTERMPTDAAAHGATEATAPDSTVAESPTGTDSDPASVAVTPAPPTTTRNAEPTGPTLREPPAALPTPVASPRPAASQTPASPLATPTASPTLAARTSPAPSARVSAVAAGTETLAPEAPGAPRKRRGTVLALLLVAAAVLAGFLFVPTLLDGGAVQDPQESQSAPDPSADPEEATGTEPDDADDPASAEPSVEAEPAPAPEDRDQATKPEGAVTGYYALLPEDTDGAWERLTGNYQSGEPIDKAYFDEFWGQFADVTVGDIAVVSDTEAEATVTYVYGDGSRESERRRYLFVEQDGILKIDESTTI